MMVMAVAAMSGYTAQAESVWSGGVDTEWAQDANGNYLIYTADELAGLASQVNNGNTYSGTTFLLMDDINLNNYSSWNPIGFIKKQYGANTTKEEKYFSGTFDGQGRYVTNCVVYLDECSSALVWEKKNIGRVTAGLFGAINGATIKNLCVKNSSFYAKGSCYDVMAGAIVAYSKGNSTITNCSAVNNKIEAKSTFGNFLGDGDAGGICGLSENSTVTNCVVASNNITTSHDSNVISEGDNATISNNNTYSNESEMTAGIAEINRATILYNNLSIGSEPSTPYYLDETTGIATDKIYYALLGVDNSKAESGSVRSDATIVLNGNKMDFEYEGTTYALYPAGSDVVVEFYLEGFSGDWTNAGYYIKEITDAGNNVLSATATYTMPETGVDENNNSTYNSSTNRFLRKQQFTIAMPSALTTLYYTTEAVIPSATDEAVATNRIYGANDAVVVEATTAGDLVIADMTGRIVYSGKVQAGRNEVALTAGFYIANGVKVAVR